MESLGDVDATDLRVGEVLSLLRIVDVFGKETGDN